MLKKLSFGKIAYTEKTKVNVIEIEIELKEKKNESFKIDWDTLQVVEADSPILSICGSIWDAEKYDIICGGQCQNEISKYVKDERLKKVKSIWDEYHLNDMKAGTKLQTDAINKWLENNKYDYDKVCEYLKSINLYIDRGYKYGTNWLYQPIPIDVVNYIKNLN